MAHGDPVEPLLPGHPLTADSPKAGDVDLAALADRIGHSFGRAELAIEALTHRGTLDKRPDLKAAYPHGNERLEFLGDRVLSLATADLLLRRFPQEREGQLARRHAALVSAGTLSEIAEAIALSDHRIAFRGAPRATPAILADMMEALLGAMVRFRATVLQPYVAELAKNVSAEGVPTMRPLWFEFPGDPAAWGVDDEFMLGPLDLVAPVTAQGATNRSVVFPAGASWRSVWDASVVEPGGVTKIVQAPLDTIPAYVRV